ncbi:hypothetical protein AVEN_93104-1 [Araneus ventricosus]|uniref:Uncharacterized protein n=1 Tax=Araneus ventricosus TaxID=182803 RepID=A0A4Y2R394_ARAVE|nr:hypothetical protein AVEN_93104-1 [Araneus ventricosus]
MCQKTVNAPPCHPCIGNGWYGVNSRSKDGSWPLIGLCFLLCRPQNKPCEEIYLEADNGACLVKLIGGGYKTKKEYFGIWCLSINFGLSLCEIMDERCKISKI